MEKKEKVEFILEQMRLCLAKKDYIRTQIISKKINTKFFDEEGTQVRKERMPQYGCPNIEVLEHSYFWSSLYDSQA